MNSKTTNKTKILSEDQEKFLGVRDLAKVSGLSESFLRKLKTHGNLPHYKVGGRVLFKYSEFSEWMEKEAKI